MNIERIYKYRLIKKEVCEPYLTHFKLTFMNRNGEIIETISNNLTEIEDNTIGEWYDVELKINIDKKDDDNG